MVRRRSGRTLACQDRCAPPEAARVRHDDAVKVGDRGQRTVVQLLGRDLGDAGLQRTGRASIGDDGRLLPVEEGALRGEGHAHVRHEPGDDDVVVTGGIDQIGQVRADVGVRGGLRDHGLALDGGDLRVDLPDLGVDVVRGAIATVVDDVDHRRPRLPRLGEQAGGSVEGWLPPVELHHAGGVGVLKVDHDQGRVGQLGGGVVEAVELAKRRACHRSPQMSWGQCSGRS